MLYHFSEDPTIDRFVPHIPPTNPSHEPAVWAIDVEHTPLYWFPRDCPRVTAWTRNPTERAVFEATFATAARRVHAIESGWLARVRAVQLFRYDLPGDAFMPWETASGQWIATTVVRPLAVVPMGDLLAVHAAADIELGVEPSLWPVHDLAISECWNFSIVRMANAQPRPRPEPATGTMIVR